MGFEKFGILKETSLSYPRPILCLLWTSSSQGLMMSLGSAKQNFSPAYTTAASLGTKSK